MLKLKKLNPNNNGALEIIGNTVFMYFLFFIFLKQYGTQKHTGGLKGSLGHLVSPSGAYRGQTLGSLGATPKRGIQFLLWNFNVFIFI